jgi:hypothetical protein
LDTKTAGIEYIQEPGKEAVALLLHYEVESQGYLTFHPDFLAHIDGMSV